MAMGLLSMLGSLGGGYVQGQNQQLQADAVKQQNALRTLQLQQAQDYQKWLQSMASGNPSAQGATAPPGVGGPLAQQTGMTDTWANQPPIPSAPPLPIPKPVTQNHIVKKMSTAG